MASVFSNLPNDLIINIIKLALDETKWKKERGLKLSRHLELKYCKTMRRTPLKNGCWKNQYWLFKSSRRNKEQMERDAKYKQRPLKLKNYKEQIDWTGD